MTVQVAQDFGYGTVVKLEKRERVAWMTLNRPEKRNAMSLAMHREIVSALAECERDEGVRIVVLTGAGDKAFCSGNDLGDYRRRLDDRAFDVEMKKSDCYEPLRTHSKIVIAAVNGYCLAGGLSLMLMCDLAIASAQAKFGLPEIYRGNFPAPAAAFLTHSGISKKQAFWIVMTGRNIDAQEALNWGLINQVVPFDQLYSCVEELAKEMATFDPIHLQGAKRGMNEAISLDLPMALRHHMAVGSEIERESPGVWREGLDAWVSGTGKKAL